MLSNTNRIVNLPIEWGKLGQTVLWCERNCTGDWKYECVEPAGMDAGWYEFYFDNEVDYVNFSLWKA